MVLGDGKEAGLWGKGAWVILPMSGLGKRGHPQFTLHSSAAVWQTELNQSPLTTERVSWIHKLRVAAKPR